MYKNLPDYLSYKDNILHYEGVNLLDLVSTYGSPLEVAYTDMIKKKINYLKDLFKTTIRNRKYQGEYFYAYATKANYYSEVISTALNAVDYLETSSGYDLDIIEKLYHDKLIPSGFTIISNGFKKGYYFDKICSLKNQGLNIIPVIENCEEADMFLDQKIDFEVGMRINIDEQMVGSFLNTERIGSAIDTRFGIYFEDMVNYANKINASSHLKFKLFHFHLGGSIHDIDQYGNFVKYLFEKNYCVLKTFCPDLEYFDIGGGFPVQFNLDFNFDYTRLVDTIVSTLKKSADLNSIPHPNIIGEHGWYTANDHGFYLCDIITTKKTNQGSYWYIINSSLMTFLPDSWGTGKDFVILPVNLNENNMVKVKLGGITCDPDDTYYKQEKMNFLYLPEVKPGEKLTIGIFGTGAYQEMIAGVGGVHHCLMPESSELIIRKKGGKLHFNHINNKQTPKEVMNILDYNDTHNLIQYLDAYDIKTEEFDGSFHDYYDLLQQDFPQSEIFPFNQLESAYDRKKLKIILLYNDNILTGYAFVTVLDASDVIVINYLVILNSYRDKGFGHIFVNELKSRFSKYYALLVEVEKPEGHKVFSDKHRRIKFYEDLNFSQQKYDYNILATGTGVYLPMLLYICNLKNRFDYHFKFIELSAILDEYYQVLFGSDYKKQYKIYFS